MKCRTWLYRRLSAISITGKGCSEKITKVTRSDHSVIFLSRIYCLVIFPLAPSKRHVVNIADLKSGWVQVLAAEKRDNYVRYGSRNIERQQL